MKKSLFFILAVVLCFSLAAQPYTSKDLKHVTQTTYKMAHGAEKAFMPTERPSDYKPQARGFSEQIGETHYFTMSNCNSRSTINWSPDATTCAVVWTTGGVPSGNPLQGIRGTGINYWNHSTQTWAFPVSTDRIEQPMSQLGSPGWGMHVFTEEGECVVAHSASGGGTGGLIINTRAKHGEGAWAQQILKGPVQDQFNSTILLWHTMAAVGNTIHLVCVTDNETTFNGITTCPLYYRSTDGGLTWENYKNLTQYMEAREIGNIHTGDDFNLKVRGNHLVLAFASGRAGYLESIDGGDTWTSKIVYDNSWNWITTNVQIGPIMRASTIDAAIDDDGVVHIAFTAKMSRRDIGTEPFWSSSYPALCGLFTWKEGQPVITEQDMGVTVKADGEIDDYLYDALPYFMNAPGLLGNDKFYWWEPFDPLNQINNAYNGVGYISHPRLIATGGKVYLMYSSIIEQPMMSAALNQFFRGVFLTVSHDNGNTYNQRAHTSWLSYNENIFFCNWENYKGPDWTGDPEDSWIQFEKSSENGFPTMSTNIKNNRIICAWLNDALPFPGSEAPVWLTDPFSVYSSNIHINEAGIFNNTNEVWTGKWNNIGKIAKIENLKIYPNPANNMATISVGTNDPYTITVTNIMGQVVHTVKGQQSQVQLNVANYPAGVYIVNVKTANATASQKLIVK